MGLKRRGDSVTHKDVLMEGWHGCCGKAEVTDGLAWGRPLREVSIWSWALAFMTLRDSTH